MPGLFDDVLSPTKQARKGGLFDDVLAEAQLGDGPGIANFDASLAALGLGDATAPTGPARLLQPVVQTIDVPDPATGAIQSVFLPGSRNAAIAQNERIDREIAFQKNRPPAPRDSAGRAAAKSFVRGVNSGGTLPSNAIDTELLSRASAVVQAGVGGLLTDGYDPAGLPIQHEVTADEYQGAVGLAAQSARSMGKTSELLAQRNAPYAADAFAQELQQAGKAGWMPMLKKGFGSWRNAGQTIATFGPESFVQFLPALGVTALTKNPAIAAGATFANSGGIEFASGVNDYLQNAGVDVTDPEAMAAALADPSTLAEATDYAKTRAGIVGVADAATAGIAGRTIAPARLASRPLMRETVNLLAHTGLGAGAGAGGEFAAQQATGRDSKLDVALEGILELAQSPAEVAPHALGRIFGDGDITHLSTKDLTDTVLNPRTDHGLRLAAANELSMRGAPEPGAKKTEPGKPATSGNASAGVEPDKRLGDAIAPELLAAGNAALGDATAPLGQAEPTDDLDALLTANLSPEIVDAALAALGDAPPVPAASTPTPPMGRSDAPQAQPSFADEALARMRFNAQARAAQAARTAAPAAQSPAAPDGSRPAGGDLTLQPASSAPTKESGPDLSAPVQAVVDTPAAAESAIDDTPDPPLDIRYGKRKLPAPFRPGADEQPEFLHNGWATRNANLGERFNVAQTALREAERPLRQARDEAEARLPPGYRTIPHPTRAVPDAVALQFVDADGSERDVAYPLTPSEAAERAWRDSGQDAERFADVAAVERERAPELERLRQEAQQAREAWGANGESPMAPTWQAERDAESAAQEKRRLTAAKGARTRAARKAPLESRIPTPATSSHDKSSEQRALAPELSRENGRDDALANGLIPAVNAVIGETTVPVEYVRGLAGLPAAVRATLESRNQGRPVQTAAVYDPKGKRVYLLTDRVTDPARAAFHAAHEIAGHHGLRALLGDKLDHALDIALQNPVVARVADAIAKERKSSDRLLMAEESLAELAAATRTGNYDEIESRYGVKVPEAQRNTLKGAIARFVQRIKALFGKAGFTDADVHGLVENAWKAAREPVADGTIGGMAESTADESGFPVAGAIVDGREVRSSIPNRGSIASSLEEYRILPGVREVPFSAFTQMEELSYHSISERERTQRLAEQIKSAGEINPLIVVIDSDGPYVLEGGHRFDALRELGAKSFPALVVMDESIESTAPQTDTPAFRKWFKDSQVVDEQGNPLVVYHGTGTNIEEFNPALTGLGNDQLGSGFYFSTNPAEAEGYTTAVTQNAPGGARKIGGDDAPSVVDAYLSITNPIVVNGANLTDTDIDLTAKQAEAIIRRSPKINDSDDSPLGNWHDIWEDGIKPWMVVDVAKNYAGPSLISLENDFFRGDAGAFRDALRDVLGYDGVRMDFDNGTTHWVAWFPTQIKSVNNNGNFDPANPSILESVDADDTRLPQSGPRLAADDVRRSDRREAVTPGLIASAKQDVADQLAGFRKMSKGRPKNPRALTQRANALRAAIFDSVVSRARDIEARNPEARSLRRLFNAVVTAPGDSRLVAETLNEEVERRFAQFTNRVRNILSNEGMDRLTDAQNKQLRESMLGTRKDAPAPIQRAGQRIRKLIDTAREDLLAAGVEVGEVEDIGYLTRLYDDAAILTDPDGFLGDAERLYEQHEFPLEVGASARETLYEPEKLARFLAHAQRAAANDTVVADAVDRLKALFRSYRSSSNVRGEAAEIEQVIKGVRARVAKSYASVNASAWLHKIKTPTVSEVFNGVGASGAPLTKARVLSGSADTVMAKWLNTNMLDILDTYARTSSRKVAMAQRFGPKGEKVQELIDAASREGVPKHDLDDAVDLMESALGNYNIRINPSVKSGLDALQAWTYLGLLGRVTFSSAVESMTFAVRTGNLTHALAPLVQVVRAVGRTQHGKDLNDMSLLIGVNGNKAMEEVMQNQLGGDYGMEPKWSKLIHRFMTGVLLTPLTRAQRAYGVGAATGYLRWIAGNIANGKRTAEMGILLNELGIADHAVFADWMLAQGTLPNPLELHDADGRPTPRGQDYMTAVRRMTDQTIQNPNASHRPAWMNNPAGRVAGSIMGFSYAAYENVIRREAALSASLLREVGRGAASRRMAAALGGMAALALGQTLVSTVRELLFNAARFEDKDDEEIAAEMAALGLSRTFGLGSGDPMIQYLTGLKYQRGVGETLLGASVGTAAERIDAIASVFTDRNSPNTDTTEYRAMEAVYSGVITPVANGILSRLPFVSAPAIWAVSSKQSRQKFAGMFFDEPEVETALDRKYQAATKELADARAMVQDRIAMLPKDQWAHELARLRDEYPTALEGVTLDLYVRGGKHGGPGEPKQTQDGKPQLKLSPDSKTGSAMGELEGYPYWYTEGGKPKQATSEGIQDRITGLNKAIKNLRETDEPTILDLMSFARAAPSVDALADRYWTADDSVTRQRASRDQVRTAIDELQELRRTEKRRAVEIIEKAQRGEPIRRGGSMEPDDTPPGGVRKSSTGEGRRAEYVGLHPGSKPTVAPDVLKGAKNAPKMVMVGDYSKLPSEGVRRALDEGADGVFDPDTKKVYVVMGLDPATAKFVAYHEIAGHYGLQGSLGKDYESVLNRAMENPTVRGLAKAMQGSGYENYPNRLVMTEEALAELAAARRTGDYSRIKAERGITVPASARPGVSGMLQRVVQLTKRKLADLTGEEPKAFDDEQVYDLIENAWQYVEKGQRE